MTLQPLTVSRPLLIRTARLADAEAIQRACFPSQSLERLTDYLQWCLALDGRPTRLVALDSEQLVGHVEVTAREHHTYWAEVSSLVVAPARRGEGIGRRMVGATQRLARRWACSELRLQVSTREPELIRMYQRWGFAPRGRPMDARLWMSLPLPALAEMMAEPVSVDF